MDGLKREMGWLSWQSAGMLWQLSGLESRHISAKKYIKNLIGRKKSADPDFNDL
jgi:hypothetical protein